MHTEITRPAGRFVSLYAGAGGLDLGFIQAGFIPCWVNELDPIALATHDEAVGNYFSNDTGILNGISSYSGSLLDIPDGLLPKRGSADLVIGGPPCQGFSVAGKMNPADERSKHVFHFLDVVERVRPTAFVMENVKALYENQRWSGIRNALMDRADSLGYRTTLTLLNASDFGVPQARERMFFIGVLDGADKPVNPTATTLGTPVSVREAFSTLPKYGTPGNTSRCTAKITAAKAPVMRKSPYAGMLFNGAGRPLNLERPSITLPASMGGNKTPIIDQLALENFSVKPWVVDYHARLSEHGGSAVASDIPDYLRRLTVEEAAVLQSFPVGMNFCGPQSAKFKQIGNAVPPKLAFAVAQAVKLALCA